MVAASVPGDADAFGRVSSIELEAPRGVSRPVVDMARSILGRLDNSHRIRRPGHPQLDARISSYELAARMQMSATDALDISQESPATQEMYGLNNELTASYGRRCLMARRLVERGVRIVQIYIESQIWDNHSNLEKELAILLRARRTSPWRLCLKDLETARPARQHA